MQVFCEIRLPMEGKLWVEIKKPRKARMLATGSNKALAPKFLLGFQTKEFMFKSKPLS